MPSNFDQRHHLVDTAVMQRSGAIIDVSISLWESLALELIAIIGEEGFQSMYARSAHLNSVAFPWLLLDHVTQISASRFAGLQISLENRNLTAPAEANEASKALLITFVDILALLIGDPLTTSILQAAWIDDTSVQR